MKMLISLFYASVLLVACANSTSTNAEASTANVTATSDDKASIAFFFIKNKIAQNSGGMLKVAAISKTNGVEKVFNGQKMYQLEYQVDIETPSDGWFRVTDYVYKLQAPYQPRSVLAQVKGEGVDCAEGKVVRLQGYVLLESTDNGWRPTKDYRTTSWSVINFGGVKLSENVVKRFVGTWTDNSVLLEIIQNGVSFAIKSCWGKDATSGTMFSGNFKNGKIIAEGKEDTFYKYQIPTFEIASDGSLVYDCGAGPFTLKKSDFKMPNITYSAPVGDDGGD